MCLDRNMKTSTVLIILAVILTLIGAGFLLTDHLIPKKSTAEKTITAIYQCPEGRSITAIFHLPQDANVDIALSDGRTFSLPRAISASGARYANSDESLVFWNKGNTAFMQENSTTKYQDCVSDT